MTSSHAAALLVVVAPSLLPAQHIARDTSTTLGFTIECTECVVRQLHFEFTTPPTVIAVRDGSPAAGAGLRRGDRITHVGELDIRLPEGGHLFGHRPGGRLLRLVVERGVRVMALDIRIPKRKNR